MNNALTPLSLSLSHSLAVSRNKNHRVYIYIYIGEGRVGIRRGQRTPVSKLIIFGFRLDRAKYAPLIRLTSSISPPLSPFLSSISHNFSPDRSDPEEREMFTRFRETRNETKIKLYERVVEESSYRLPRIDHVFCIFFFFSSYKFRN